MPARRHRWAEPACPYRVLADDALLGRPSYRYFLSYGQARDFSIGRPCGAVASEVELQPEPPLPVARPVPRTATLAGLAAAVDLGGYGGRRYHDGQDPDEG